MASPAPTTPLKRAFRWLRSESQAEAESRNHLPPVPHSLLYGLVLGEWPNPHFGFMGLLTDNNSGAVQAVCTSAPLPFTKGAAWPGTFFSSTPGSDCDGESGGIAESYEDV
jgi:hypothetical protein